MTVPAAPSPSTLLADEALCAFVAGGVSVGLATCDARRRPHVVRVIGVRRDGERLRLVLPLDLGTAVLDDVADNGRVAVVFTQPTTHRTFQLKGSDARAVEVDEADRAETDRYRRALGADLAAIGWPQAYTDALLDAHDAPLATIAFTPDAVFVATPGPDAGARMEPGR
ncbi:MAG TPA: pyridoxamine 5'-phosphate oxidase family protein [Burkholderiaceae bacterium]|nr:pyridoxamine 5'-phosphate oxidase family protein [Burkholderiaceae bacterium]